MVHLIDISVLGSFVVLELPWLHHFSWKSWLICKRTSLVSFSFYYIKKKKNKNSRTLIYLIGPDADGAFCLGSWHWLWAGEISYIHVSFPPQPCLSGGSLSVRHKRVFCAPNCLLLQSTKGPHLTALSLQWRWQRPGNKKIDNKLSSKASYTPVFKAAPRSALKSGGYSTVTWPWKKAIIKNALPWCIDALVQGPFCTTAVACPDACRKCHQGVSGLQVQATLFVTCQLGRTNPGFGWVCLRAWIEWNQKGMQELNTQGYVLHSD